MIAAGRSFFRLLAGSHRWLLASTGLTLLQAVLLLPVGLLFRRAFDTTIPHGDTGELVLLAAGLAALAVASAAVSLWTRHVVLRVTKVAVAELRGALIERLNALELGVSDRLETARVHATVVQDTERVDVIATVAAADLIPSGIVVVALSAALAVLNPLLFALLVPAVLVMVAASRWISAKVTRRTGVWQRAFDRFSIRTQFVLRAHPLVVAHGTQEAETRSAREEARDLAEAGRAMAWMHNAQAQVAGGVSMLAAVLVLVVGGAAVAHHDMTIGSLVSFYALLFMVRGHLGSILYVAPMVISGKGSLDRLEELMGVEAAAGGSALPRAALPIVLRDVHFAYDREAPVLRGVELEIDAGECVAITGPNGAGKSTVGALILGLYRPAEGTLSAAGVPYDELDLGALRRLMAIVPQDPILFPGTIAENIAYGASLAGDARVRAAAARATADDFIRALPDGYETKVGDEGQLLSGGQRQRIAIARALLRDPVLLVLDEPTAGLDRDTVARLLENLRALPGDRALLLISHDPQVIAEADRVIELSAGRARAAETPLA
ncbi:MAG: hypothetical protein JWM73_737 [Solirubrobacterales bacterium]|nr:hypothetical protein [Solirubrobacterales bacterium]